MRSRIVDRFVFGRHDDLEEFAVLRPTDNRVANEGWLDPARSSYQTLWSDAFEVGLKPSSETVDKLESDIVVMSHAEFATERRDHSDHMRVRKPMCRGCDPEIAIGRVVPQAPVLKSLSLK